MVHMNRILEESSARLFSPLPLRTTLIQRHIRINTGTLVRLWPYELTSRQQFLERLRSALGTLCPGVVFDLSGIRNRYTLVPEKAVRTGGLRLPDKFSAIFSTAIWMSVTKLSATVPPNGRRNKRPPMRSVEVGPLPVKQVLVFGNSMSTDGFQTSLGYVDESQLGLTRYTGADRGGAFVPDDPPYVNDLDNNARTALLDKYTLLGADPGKRSLLTLGSGHRKDRQPPANQDGVDPVDVDGNNNDGGCIKARFEWVAGTREALRDPDYVGQGRAKQPKYEGDLLDYKATVRADEAGHTRNAAEARNQMANYKASTTIDIKAIETSLGTNGRSACSCMLESFRGYLLRRQQVLASLRVYYATKSHRRRRYRSLIGSKSSIDKFVARIKAKYTVQSGETGEDVPIAIMYGDWSNPNGFRGGGPTLSVGLRRALSLIFVLVLVNEFRTSSCCPVCMGPVMHPLNRVTIRLPPASDAHPHPNDDGPRETRAPVHHLLRCPRAECKSQWWNRDALAVANITAKALRVLRHEPQHQVYGPDGVDNPNTPEQES
ncbi:hypothetical protein BC828DRAFT_436528 [Blastocladiella britannica]|nr:hypothetical protein BC828DRAFT_436528 [Blastocladiella britannica]